MNIGLIVHALIRNDRGQILILQRQPRDTVLPDVWDIPGGTLEAGEDPVDGVIRETREETRLDISQVRLLTHTSNVDQKKNKQFVRLIFQSTVATNDVHLRPDEHSDFQWVDPASPPASPFVDYLPACFRQLVE